jgi:hypothetical protein
MSIGNTFENDLMKLIFCATSIAALAQDSNAPLTVLWYSLHTADPGEAGDQTTSEATYTNYARVSVARTTVGHIVTNNSVSPGAAVAFPAAASGDTNTITHAVVGKTSSGAGEIYFSGSVTPNISVSNGVTPRLTTASAITID